MLKVIELFAGLGSQTQALKNIGVEHEVVAISEIDKYAVQSYEALHGKANNLGDITKIQELPRADLWTYSFPCFTADTLVLTDSGYKKITNIAVGDKVLTHKNRYRNVTATYEQGIKAILKIQGMGIDEIKCTPNHRFYVRTRNWKYRYNPNTHYREFDTPIWKEAKDLNVDDFLGVAINQNNTVPTWDGITFHWNDGRKDRHKNELSLLMSNKDFWWFIGRYMGDGWQRHQGGVILCCDTDELEEIEERIKGLFHYNISKERTVYKIHISQKELGLFVKQFGKGEKGKRLTDAVFDLPTDLLKEFLDGYISADGCFTNNRFKATSISRELIYGIAQCIAKVYKMPYSIYLTKRPPKCVIEGRIVNQNDSYDLAYKTEPKKQDNAFYEDGYVWFPIRKIEECGVAPVYDISVEEDESFTANGVIAHNCQDISVAGRQAGIKEGTRSGLLFEVERLLTKAKENGNLPKYLLLENVKNLVGKKFKADYDEWLAFLSGLGYNNYWQVLNAKNYGIPQNRERVFCVSILSEHAPYIFPEKQELKLRLKDMIDEVVDERFYLKDSTIRSIMTSNFHQRRSSLRPTDGIANTLCARDWREPQCVQVGALEGGKWDKVYTMSRRVFAPDGISPTVHCCGGGNTELKIVAGQMQPKNRDYNAKGLKREEQFEMRRDELSNAVLTQDFKNCISEVKIGAMRGRNLDNSSDRTAGIATAQRLEINENGTSNTLTTVTKDNLVVCEQRTDEGLRFFKGDVLGTLRTKDSCGDKRVIDAANIRVRKLTPRECLRLMGWKDFEIDKIQNARISNCQQYKQAGNGIVVNVLEAIFRNLFLGEK